MEKLFSVNPSLCGTTLLTKCQRKKSLGIIVSTAVLIRVLNSWRKRYQLNQKVIQRQKEREQNVAAIEQSLLENGHVMTSRREAIVAMTFSDLRHQLQTGSVTAVEALQAFQAKALLVHKDTNAITGFLTDALDRAKQLDKLPEDQRKPLHGMPISLKEHINLTGLDSTVGIPSNLGKVSEEDAGAVLVLKELGALPFCRTNLPQTCISFDCSNPIYGATRNPRNFERSPGGSSGGEGALIAGGGSLMGFGSDLGGSVRMPAIFSGITALKPTSGRIPLTGQGSDGGLAGVVGLHNTLGLMARSANDISVCLKEMLNLENAQGITADPRLVHIPWRDSVAKTGTKKLKIGWYEYDGCMEATPGIRRAVAEAKKILEHQGHELVPYCPPDLLAVYALYGELMSADGWENTLDLLRYGTIDQQSLGLIDRIWHLPNKIKKILGPLMAVFYSPSIAGMFTNQFVAEKSKVLWKKNAFRLELVQAILRDWEEHGIDAIIAPGLGSPSQPLGYPAWELGAISYTCVYNLLNFPAGSLPVTSENEEDQRLLKQQYPGKEVDPQYGWVKDGTTGAQGMPLNVQVIGRPWCEELVLRVMQELEANVQTGIPVHL